MNVLAIGLSLALTIISSCAQPIRDPPITWPLTQIIAIALLLVILYVIKPLPKSLINQLPGFTKRLIAPFIRADN